MFPDKLLGFGLMRLPKKDGEIDHAAVCELADRFLEQGCTYFDTAYIYEGSEEAFRKAISERHPRDSYLLANKLPYWNLHKQEDLQACFDESLRRCGVSYFDFYLLHCVRRVSYEVYEKYDSFAFLREMKQEDKVRYIGFSFHDTPEMLDDILAKHPEVDFVQLQLNYMDRDNELVQSRGVHEVACKHGKPIVVMEPVKGGTLANLPEHSREVLNAIHPDASPASWALRYVAGLDNVRVILSGMSSMEQLNDNLVTLENPKPINDEEMAAIDTVTQQLLDVATIPCTGCRYCVDNCPMGILIPDLIRSYNNGLIYGYTPRQRNSYENYTTFIGHNPASACIGCGACQATCPQSLDVPSILKAVAEKLEE